MTRTKGYGGMTAVTTARVVMAIEAMEEMRDRFGLFGVRLVDWGLGSPGPTHGPEDCR